MTEPIEDRVAALDLDETEAEDAFAAYTAAIVGATGELGNPPKTKTAKIVTRDKGSYEYSYAGADDIRDEIREPLMKYGLTLLQPTFVSGGVLYVRTVIVHEAGHVEEFGTSDLDVVGQTIQQIGSAATYLRRYAALGALGLAPEDNDGGSVPAPASPGAEAMGSSPASGGRRYPKAVRDCAHTDGVNEEGRCIGCGRPITEPIDPRPSNVTDPREGGYGP